ncbi:hypothetical protein GZ212_05385 [Mangrovimonas sp. CR14]|uniref:hypothetical protein n=1 Tax=Mangrovimonas sp. CR14 TaxID=2706120 RepID=UPI00142397AB|nr:hypothetical protein [Mangrovimonas sp. CR14]NIK91577.1 hypothetical protein [Mangrovimonas sp. CR14]
MKKMFLTGAIVLIGLASYGQSNVDELRDLVDARASSLDNAMEDEGYRFIKSNKAGNTIHQYWWSRRRDKCVMVRVSDGRVKSIYKSNSSNCDDDGSSSSYNNNRDRDRYRDRDRDRRDFYHSYDNDRSHDNYQTYVNGSATSMYRKLQDDNFKEIKLFQKDGYTYKLWYNYRSKECLKTVSYDYKLEKILFSHHCDENL